MGVLSALPIIAAGNLCCCLWVVSGGVVAAYLLQQNQTTPITQQRRRRHRDCSPASSARSSISCISIPITLLIAPMERQMLERLMENSNNMPPNSREFMEQPVRRHVRRRHRLRLACSSDVPGAIFSTIGGLLGAVFFRKPLPPADATSSS